MSTTESEECSRKYIIEYKHNHSERECIAIIGTIDSLMYNLTENLKSGSNYFRGLLETIEEYGLTKVNKSTGTIKYAGKTIKLDKKTELWIDESQDLGIYYFRAIIKLMLETKIDVVIVGDKLQSLEHKVNFMTCTEDDIPNINIIREIPINVNRRIKVDGMADKTNSLIRFSNHGLTPIIIEKPDELIKRAEPTIEIINTQRIYAGMKDGENKKRVESFVMNIIEKVKHEVKLHNYLPEDFLFIFPIMKNNVIAPELETKLNEYWIEKMPDSEIYKNFAVIHKHEEGQVIDMSLSEHASRIVTIRSSKGDGRKVVFVLDCTEASLKLVSRSDDIDLIYESYIHVALTRAKEKIYFGLERNNDEIHQRFGSEGLVEYAPKIKTKIQHHKIIQNIDKDKIVELLKKNNIEEPQSESKLNDKNNKPIDWEYHCIRRAIYLQYAIFNIFEKSKSNNNFHKSQLRTVLDKISKLSVHERSPNKFYTYMNSLDMLNELDFLPLCNLSHKSVYKTYTHKIKNHIEENIEEYRKDKMSLSEQSPVKAVLQWYVIELYKRKQYCETTPTTIYNIIDHFERDDETKLTELMREAEIIKETTTKAMKEILDADENVEWNIEHMVKMAGCCSDFELYYRDIPIIGWGDTCVYHFVLLSDLSQLNFWETMIKIIVERFILFNPSDKGKDIEKFKGKQIKTYVFVLKQNRYELFDWDWDDKKIFNVELKQLFRNAVVKYFSTFNIQLFQYCTFIKKSDIWKEEFKSPYDYIASGYDDVIYVRDFFKNLHERSKDDKASVKNITDNSGIFCDKLGEKIEEMCNMFFGLNERTNDNDEW